MGNNTEQDPQSILGYAVKNASPEQCVNQIVAWINGASQKVFFCANPHSLVMAKNDQAFQEALHNADLLTPDGIGIVLASRILGGKISERVTGSDVFWGLSEILNAQGGKSCFFLGSTEATLATIRERMALDFPDIHIAGTYSPPFKQEFSSEDDRAMLEAVNLAAPDVLWVGMTAPKQEKWVHRHRSQLNVTFIGAIGAVFDFYSGNVNRSYPIFQRLGLEWLPRLIQEPRRLFRRNFVSSPLFLLHVFHQLLNRRP